MNTCPSCSKTVDPNQLACPHCGISLHPGTATAGPASTGGGSGMSVAAIAVVAIVGIVALLACLGVPALLLFGVRRAMVPPAPATPVSSPLPPIAPTAISASPPVTTPSEAPLAVTPEDQPPAEQQ